MIQVNARFACIGESAAMPSSFTTFALRAEDIAVAFPLVRAIDADIDLGRWRSFARPMVDAPATSACGAIGLRSTAGYICGLLIYRAERDLRHDAVLAIDLFTALDLFNEERAIRALLQVADEKARELNCAVTHIRIGAAQASLAQHFAAAGHRPEATLFCKAVELRPRAN